VSNRRLDAAAAGAGYYGRDAAGQRGRIQAQARPMAERIEQGQLLAGSPDTVLAQARRIRDELGAGILEVVFSPMGREKTLHAIELFGNSVLPRLRDL
jgi:alkanesulfonate monooxygenase SsuD/methylene tetrahydromethanopterin reductase-like flavin-dependent oxidoreductase (luciferase family)